MRLSLPAAVVVVLSFLFDARAKSWRTYHNDRFGATAEVSANWNIQPPPANGDGRRFTSPDGRAKISIHGSFRVSDTIQEDMAIEGDPGGGVVTYKKQGPRSIVISGIRGHTIFYHKAIATCQDKIWNSLWVDYPVSAKEKYDSLVTHVSRSLRGAEADECN